MNSVHKSKPGGVRAGAGRPKGRNRYGESTVPLRIPLSLVDNISQYLDIFAATAKGSNFKVLGKINPNESSLNLPLQSSLVKAGFPSPAEDYVESVLDLNQLLVGQADATFLVRIDGDSMQDAGINAGDICVVDKSLQPQHLDIIIATVNNEFTIKRLYSRGSTVKLIAENPDYKDITLANFDELSVWGVVTSCIKKFK